MNRTFPVTAHARPWRDSAGGDKGDIHRSGYTCVEVAAVQFVISLTLISTFFAGKLFGNAAGITAGAIVASAACLIVRSFYRRASRWSQQEMLKLNERFPRVYRVLFVLPDLPCVIANGAEIRVGDYGWEAEPIYDDGLIYLHGLTEEWTVAWHAGFGPEQVELVGEKPQSQYFFPYSWTCAGAKPPPCPFPVQHAPEESLGFPQRIDFPFVQGMKVDVMGKRD